MRAGQAGVDGLVDDDVAFAKPWGFELTAVRSPVLLAHGLEDRVVPHTHAEHLLRALPQRRAVAAPQRRARVGARHDPARAGLAQRDPLTSAAIEASRASLEADSLPGSAW